MNQKQLNVNTILILLVGALLGFGIKKLDETNTQLITLTGHHKYMAERLADLRAQMERMVLKSDFESEISRLNREIEFLKKRRSSP